MSYHGGRSDRRAEFYNNDRDRARDRDRDRIERGRDSGAPYDRDRVSQSSGDYRPHSDRDREGSRITTNMTQPSMANYGEVEPHLESHPGATVSRTSPFGQGTRPKSSTQDLARVTRDLFDVGLGRVEIDYERLSQKRVAKQKEDEYERTKHRHADYPVMREMYLQFLKKQDVKREELNKKREQNDEIFNQLADSFAHSLINALPALVERKEAQKSVDPGLLRNLQERVNSISQSTEQSGKNYDRLEKKQKELEENNKALGKQIKDLEGNNESLGKQVKHLEENNESLCTQVKNLEHENNALSKRCEDMDKLISSLSQRMNGMESTINADRDTFVTRLSTLESKDSQLERELGAHRSEVERLQGTSSGQKTTIDTEATTTLLELKKDIATIRESALATANKLDGEASKLQTVQQQVPVVFGTMVDNLRTQTNSTESRVTMLEAASGTGVQPASLKELKDQIQAAHDKCEMNTMAITSLDHQMNNLTTKEVSDQIIGHMELLMPNPRQLQDDMQAIAAKMEGLDNVVEQKVEQKLERLCDSHNNNHLQAQANMDVPESPADRTRAGKKRRHDMVNNHHGNGAVNGHRNGISNGHGH